MIRPNDALPEVASSSSTNAIGMETSSWARMTGADADHSGAGERSPVVTPSRLSVDRYSHFLYLKTPYSAPPMPTISSIANGYPSVQCSSGM